MLRIYHPALLPEHRPVEVLWPILGRSEGWQRWSDLAFNKITEPLFEVVSSPEKADFFLLPHNYNHFKQDTSYVQELISLARDHQKKVIIFFPGDSAEILPWSEAIVLRQSQYKSMVQPNEIIMPGYVEDLSAYRPYAPREKEARPVVGFCGWANLPTTSAKFKFSLKMIIQRCLELLGLRRYVERQGLWFRQKSLAVLAKNPYLATNFIIRESYSGNEKTISLDKETARREYIDSIFNSHLILTVKGDGNFSTRFYEVLSLGRIPLFVDTDCPLPLEDVIDYDAFMIRVPSTELANIDQIVTEKFKSLSNQEFISMQEQGRAAFEKYLRMDAFLDFLFKSERIMQYAKK